MDIESALVAKAIASGEFSDLISRGIEPEHFADDDVREVFEYAQFFLREHKQSPSMTAIKAEFPDWKPKLSKDPTSYHIGRFVNVVRERKAIELLRGYHDLLEDPSAIEEIEVHALDMARELALVVPQPRAGRLSEGKKRKEEYYKRKREGIQHGVPLGIPTFDELTLGVQPHELLIWGGPPGGGKTTGLQYSALSAYLQMNTVLFISLEVEEEQILRKFDVMLSNVRYRALKALELNVGEEEAWHKILEAAEKERMEHDIIVKDDIKNCTVEKVGAQQLRYKPNVVVVDYLEEMRTPRGMAGWEGVQENGRGLKQSARVTKTPHYTATQLNREGETSYQSAQKIADMLIVLQPDEEDEVRNEMRLVMRKYRDGPSRREATMRWDLERMDIKEKGAEERFPKRNNPSLRTDERKRERKLAVAEIVRDQANPFVKRRRDHGGGIAAARRRVSHR